MNIRGRTRLQFTPARDSLPENRAHSCCGAQGSAPVSRVGFGVSSKQASPRPLFPAKDINARKQSNASETQSSTRHSPALPALRK